MNQRSKSAASSCRWSVSSRSCCRNREALEAPTPSRRRSPPLALSSAQIAAPSLRLCGHAATNFWQLPVSATAVVPNSVIPLSSPFTNPECGRRSGRKWRRPESRLHFAAIYLNSLNLNSHRMASGGAEQGRAPTGGRRPGRSWSGRHRTFSPLRPHLPRPIAAKNLSGSRTGRSIRECKAVGGSDKILRDWPPVFAETAENDTMFGLTSGGRD
jgi:hypothetical protein